MRRGRERSAGRRRGSIELKTLEKQFDRAEVAAAYLFGSGAAPHELSDIDLAYLGTSSEAEDRVFDELYEALQRELGEGNFDLVPLRRAPLHLQFTIATEGRLFFSKDAVAAERFGARAIARYLDFKPYRDEYFSVGD